MKGLPDMVVCSAHPGRPINVLLITYFFDLMKS